MLNTWRKIPVVRLVLPFVGGILFQVNFGFPLPAMVMLSGLLFVLLGVLTHWRTLREHSNKLFNICISAFYFALGAILFSIQKVDENPLHFGQFNGIEMMDAVMVTPPERTANSYKTTLEIRQVLAEGEIHVTTGKCLLYVSNRADMNWKKGDRVLIPRMPQTIEAPQNPDEFDYQSYLFNHGITHRVYLRDPSQAVLIEAGFAPGITHRFDNTRDWLVEKLRHALSDHDAFAVSSALILGQKEFLSPQIRHTYSSTGAMHVLAVSGLHVGIIYLLLMGMLKWLGKNRWAMWIRLLFILFGLWSYAIITGLSPSVLRAATMFSAVAIAQNISRKTNIFNTLATAALVLLCINPMLINEIGFQLSFAAVLGIVLLQPHIYGLLAFQPWLIDKLWQLTSVSLAAQLATFPLGIYYFHQFPNYFLLSNFVVIPAAFVVLLNGLVFFAVSWIPVLGDIIGNLLNLIVFLLNTAVQSIENLPYSLTSGLYASAFDTWVTFGVIGFFIALVYRKDVHYVLGMLMGVLLLMGSFTYRLYERNQLNTIAVNQISGHFAINLIDANQNILIADSALLANERAQQFHLVNHWYRRGHENAHYIDLNDTSIVTSPGFYRNKNFVSFHGYRLLLIPDKDHATESLGNLVVDAIVLGGKSKWRDFHSVNSHAVLSSGYQYRKLCCDSVPDYHDVRRQGAFLVDLRHENPVPHLANIHLLISE